MIRRILKRWLDRRERDESQVVIEALRTRVENLESAFSPIVRMFPDRHELRAAMEDTNNRTTFTVGQYSAWELYQARCTLQWANVQWDDIPEDLK